MTRKESCVIIYPVIKMLENKSFNIKEIFSVDLIKPKASEGKIVRYGDKIPRYELIYKLSGEVTTHFNKNVFQIKPGNVYIIPKTDNADYYIERTVPGDCIDIFFDTDDSLGDNLIMLNLKEDNKLQGLFQKIYKLWITKPSGYYFKCMSATYEIFYEIISKREQYSPKSKYRVLEKGVEYLHNNLYREIDYKRPSELCGISYTYFKKLFIEKFGIPPVQYVNNIRLERSRELLLTNKYSVGEIAEICGFKNAYYFSKRFKEAYQLSPTDYKNSEKTNHMQSQSL